MHACLVRRSDHVRVLPSDEPSDTRQIDLPGGRGCCRAGVMYGRGACDDSEAALEAAWLILGASRSVRKKFFRVYLAVGVDATWQPRV